MATIGGAAPGGRRSRSGAYDARAGRVRPYTVTGVNGYTVLPFMPVQSSTPSATGKPARGALRSRLVGELRERVASGALRAGAALPSVRAFARERAISAFTAAEVYNVLVATGLIEARRGRGYFVAGVPGTELAVTRSAATADALWERRLDARAERILVDAGGGWLPAGWQYGDGIRAALRALARQPLSAHGYGSPF